MATLPEGQGGSTFTPHPAGAFMAVCCDVFMKEQPNKYKGQANNRGQVDTRETVTKLCISFITTEMIEIEGKMKPRYASAWFSASWGTVDYPSNARDFVKTWQPKITDQNIAKLDTEKLVGLPAWLTIVHNVGKDGKTYANVKSAVMPPPGQPAPLIPADFVRHDHKPENAATAKPEQAQAPAHIKGEDEDSMPF